MSKLLIYELTPKLCNQNLRTTSNKSLKFGKTTRLKTPKLVFHNQRNKQKYIQARISHVVLLEVELRYGLVSNKYNLEQGTQEASSKTIFSLPMKYRIQHSTHERNLQVS